MADEVGLGKTIEACLVLKEYWMRGLVRKALVLTPPSLVSQWKGELIEKFGLAPVSPDGAEFRRDPPQFWKSEPLVVSSIAQARLDLHAKVIADVPWDMVVVDEAHCLKNRSSANWRLVDSLQKKFILMLTATPVENNLIELYNLITLLKSIPPYWFGVATQFTKLLGHPDVDYDFLWERSPLSRGRRQTAAPHRRQRPRDAIQNRSGDLRPRFALRRRPLPAGVRQAGPARRARLDAPASRQQPAGACTFRRPRLAGGRLGRLGRPS